MRGVRAAARGGGLGCEPGRPDRGAGKRREKRSDGVFLGDDAARGIARADGATRCAGGGGRRTSIAQLDPASDRDPKRAETRGGARTVEVDGGLDGEGAPVVGPGSDGRGALVEALAADAGRHAAGRGGCRDARHLGSLFPKVGPSLRCAASVWTDGSATLFAFTYPQRREAASRRIGHVINTPAPPFLPCPLNCSPYDFFFRLAFRKWVFLIKRPLPLSSLRAADAFANGTRRRDAASARWDRTASEIPAATSPATTAAETTRTRTGAPTRTTPTRDSRGHPWGEAPGTPTSPHARSVASATSRAGFPPRAIASAPPPRARGPRPR